jgi:hypothetical protein
MKTVGPPPGYGQSASGNRLEAPHEAQLQVPPRLLTKEPSRLATRQSCTLPCKSDPLTGLKASKPAAYRAAALEAADWLRVCKPLQTRSLASGPTPARRRLCLVLQIRVRLQTGGIQSCSLGGCRLAAGLETSSDEELGIRSDASKAPALSGEGPTGYGTGTGDRGLGSTTRTERPANPRVPTSNQHRVGSGSGRPEVKTLGVHSPGHLEAMASAMSSENSQAPSRWRWLPSYE